jgi:hypothetical protein
VSITPVGAVVLPDAVTLTVTDTVLLLVDEPVKATVIVAVSLPVLGSPVLSSATLNVPDPVPVPFVIDSHDRSADVVHVTVPDPVCVTVTDCDPVAELIPPPLFSTAA